LGLADLAEVAAARQAARVALCARLLLQRLVRVRIRIRVGFG
jgi:hypothetical protein